MLQDDVAISQGDFKRMEKFQELNYLLVKICLYYH